VQWSNWQPFDFYYTEGRDGSVISRWRIPAGNLRYFVALHPAFGYQLFSYPETQLVGVVRWGGENWTVNGAIMEYFEAHELVERWYRDGKEVLLWQCFCPACNTADAKRLAAYVNAPITHGVCAAGGAEMILQVNRELDESFRANAIA
jgi:hypothetical protein